MSSRRMVLALLCLTVGSAVAFAAWLFAAPPATGDWAVKDLSFRKRVDRRKRNHVR